jgi:ADP-ribose pyrophosphatase
MAAQKKPLKKQHTALTKRQKPAKKSGAKPLTPKKRTKTHVLSSKEVFKGRVFSVFRDEVIEPTGVKNTREIIRHNGSVVILAVDESTNPADPEIILERQYRHAAGQFLLELPAGRVEKGESTLAAAKREMIEETGYRANKWSLLTKYFASPGFLGEWMQIYLAQGISQGKAEPEDDEQIEVRRLPLSEVLNLIAANKIHDGKTLIGIMLYDSLRRSGRL